MAETSHAGADGCDGGIAEGMRKGWRCSYLRAQLDYILKPVDMPRFSLKASEAVVKCVTRCYNDLCTLCLKLIYYKRATTILYAKLERLSNLSVTRRSAENVL